MYGIIIVLMCVIAFILLSKNFPQKKTDRFRTSGNHIKYGNYYRYISGTFQYIERSRNITIQLSFLSKVGIIDNT